jgi:hypothetical protein
MRKTLLAIAAAAVLASSGAWAKELTDAEWHLKFDLTIKGRTTTATSFASRMEGECQRRNRMHGFATTPKRRPLEYVPRPPLATRTACGSSMTSTAMGSGTVRQDKRNLSNGASP